MENQRSFSTKAQIEFIVLFLLASIIISACGTAEMDVTVYSRDRFDMKHTIQIPNDMLQMMGGPSEIEAQLDELLREAREENYRVRWRKISADDRNTTTYEVIFPRTDIEEAVDAGFFTWQEVQYNNRKAYRIDFFDVSELSSSFMSFTLNLQAGRILDTNGTQVNSSKVTWVNPTRTPYAIVTPKGTVGWIPLVLGIMMLGMLGVGVTGLLVSGKMKEWGAASINAGKWKIQETRLKGQQKKITKEKEGLITELGKKAWEIRVLHPSYTEPFFKLESLEEQKLACKERAGVLNKEFDLSRETRANVTSDYSLQINDLQSQQKDVGKRLNQSKLEQSRLQQEVSKIIKDQEKAQSEIKAYQDKLIEVRASDSPEKESQAESLSNAIYSLESSLQNLINRVPEIENRLSSLKIEQQPLEDQITRLNEQILIVQKDQKEALAPIDQRIAQLEGEIKAKKLEIDELHKKMSPIIDSLGPMVNSARPDSHELTAIYDQIDRVIANLVSVSQEHGLVSTRLETSDKGAARSFYIMAAGILILVILALVFIVLAFI
jgi:hypothetical protein